MELINVLIELLEKGLYLIFFISVLNIIRHGFLFFRNILKKEPGKYEITKQGLIYLGVSIGIFLTLIITGFNL